MARSKSCFENDTRDLINHLTGIKEDDENFGRCMQYALSNFKYHRFLGVNSHLLEKTLNGMRQKFLVHSQAPKAVALDALTDRFLQSHAFEGCERAKTDTHYALLSLLLCLAESPTNSDFTQLQPLATQREKNEDTFDWGKHLLEGDFIYRPELRASSPEWSDDDDEEDVIAEPRQVQWPSVMTDSGIAATPNDDATPIGGGGGGGAPWWEAVEAARGELAAGVMEQYWMHPPHPPHPRLQSDDVVQRSSRLASLLETNEVTITMTEHQVMREVLWMIAGGTDSYVFHRVDSHWRVRPGVCVSHLSQQSLSSDLAHFARYGDIVFTLNNFIHSVVSPDSDSATTSQTYEAFAESLSRVLQSYRRHLLEVEKEVCRQEIPVTLMTLKSRLAAKFTDLDLVFSLYRRGVEGCEGQLAVSGRATRLLSAVYSIMLESDMLDGDRQRAVSVLLPIWLSTCRPYLDIVDVWMSTGYLIDHHAEFIVQRNADVASTDEKFWTDALAAQRDKTTSDATANGDATGDASAAMSSDASQTMSTVDVPTFLQPVLASVLAVGKSVEILQNMKAGCVDDLEVSDSPTLYDTFVTSLRIHYPTLMTPPADRDNNNSATLSETSALTPDVDACLRVPGVDESLLRINVRQVFAKDNGATYMTKEHDPGDAECSAGIITPLERMLHLCLYPHIQKRCDVISDRLLTEMTDTYGLRGYFSAVKSFYLMEAGETMNEFYTEIFNKLRRCEPWRDASFLNSTLQQALQTRFPAEADRLFLTVDDAASSKKDVQPIAALDCLTLHYEVPWPINMVIDSRCIAIYNEVFRFLLQIKRALYALQRLSFADLEKTSSAPTDKWHPLVDVPSKPACRLDLIHRVQIFRMRLLHFVNSLHNYMMTRIVHSTEDECDHSLLGANHLDAVLNARRQHAEQLHQQCLRHPSHSLISEVINRVLSLALALQTHWNEGVDNLSSSTLDQLVESFTRCIQFLSSFLNNAIKRGSFPHLESLAFALITSGE